MRRPIFVAVAVVALAIITGVVLDGRQEPDADDAMPSAAKQPAAKTEVAGHRSLPAADSVSLLETGALADIGDSVMRVLSKEAQVLPYQRVTAEIRESLTAAVGAARDAGGALPDALRPMLVDALLLDLRWKSDPTLDDFRRRQEAISRFLYDKPLDDPAALTDGAMRSMLKASLAGGPTLRFVLCDRPVRIEAGNPAELFNSSPFMQGRLRERLNRPMVVVRLYSVRKVTDPEPTPTPYWMSESVFVLDPKAQVKVFFPLVTNEKAAVTPDGEIPLFLRR